MNCSTHAEREAAFYCEACEKFLCDQCKVTHNAVYEGDHELTPVEPIAPSSAPESDHCSAHTENVMDMFCNDCHGIFKINSHIRHTFLSLSLFIH